MYSQSNDNSHLPEKSTENSNWVKKNVEYFYSQFFLNECKKILPLISPNVSEIERKRLISNSLNVFPSIFKIYENEYKEAINSTEKVSHFQI